MILSSASSGLPLVIGLLTAVAVLAYALAALMVKRGQPRLCDAALLLAWALHLVVLLNGLFGSPARFGFGPALSATAWFALTVYGIERHMLPKLKARAPMALLGAGAVVLATMWPGTELHPRLSLWMPLHWLLGLASYGLFATAVVHAVLMNRAEKQMRSLPASPDVPAGIPLLTLERLMFRFVEMGFVLLTATLVVGWVFAERFYGSSGVKLDHKTVFSVLSWLTFAALLLGRQFAGWRGRKATRVLYAGAVLLLLAYVGSRFVLEVMLGRAPV